MAVCCRKCGDSSFYLQQKGMQVGLYCSTCGSWIKWVSKQEQVLYKNRGMKIHAQGEEIELKMKDFTPMTKPTSSLQSLGLEVEETSKNVVSNIDDNNAFGTNPAVSTVDIESEVQRRVTEILKQQGIISTVSSDVEISDTVVENEKVGSEYCPICDGNPLEPETDYQVEVSIFSGLMTITDKQGENILGLFKLKRCPNCGKIF